MTLPELSLFRTAETRAFKHNGLEKGVRVESIARVTSAEGFTLFALVQRGQCLASTQHAGDPPHLEEPIAGPFHPEIGPLIPQALSPQP